MKPVLTASDPKLILAGTVLEMLMFLRVCLTASTSVLPIIVGSGVIFHIWLFLLITIRSTGLRDDLTFLLEEDLSNINLCSLHCEMRNCEQLLGSLGLFAHRVGSLDALNQALSDHGPESCKGFSRVTVKLKPGQQTDVERSNIKVASFSGFLLKL